MSLFKSIIWLALILSQDLQATLLEILAEREAIRSAGEALHREKNDILTDDPKLRTLRNSYDIGHMRLIARIIQNSRRSQNCTELTKAEKALYARKDLGNISLCCALMTDTYKCFYTSRITGYDNGNFWNDFAYLSNFDLQDPDPRHRPIGAITDEEVAMLMRSEAIELLDLTCTLESLAYNVLDYPVLMWGDLRDAHRAQYRDHRLLPTLYKFTADRRERYFLSNAIHAIQRARELHYGTPLTRASQNIHKSALLHALVVIGEACTSKNITPETKALGASITEGSWRLMIHLRNRFAHVEWDIASRSLEGYLATHDGRELLSSLEFLEMNLGGIAGALAGFTPAERAAHYAPTHAPTPMVLTVHAALDPIQNLCDALPCLNGAQERTSRKANPMEYSRVTLLRRIQEEEIPALEQIFDLPCKEALADHFPEDVDAMVGESVETVFDIMHHLNIRPSGDRHFPQLEDAIHRIRGYYAFTREDLTLELPKDLFMQLSSRIGAGGFSGMSLAKSDLRTRLNGRFLDYARAIHKFGRSRLLGLALARSPERVDAALHHFGRIGKFLAEIPIEPAADSMTAAEFGMFRNFAQHGSEKIEASSLRDHDFLMRYFHILIYELMPALRRAGLDIIGPVLPTEL